MNIRALIVAVEKYPKASGLAPVLEGTNAAGDQFRSWFIATKHGGNDPGPDFLRYCGEAGRPGVTAGTTRNEILDELEALVLAGKDSTSQIYIFFSGHGFAFEERPGKQRLSILLGSDFVDLAHGGRASIPVDSLQEKAQMALGPGDQYYFIDACRNVIGPQDVTPLPVDNVWPVSRNSLGCVLTLFSTRSGAKASVKSGFADSLVAGLGGAGKAKARLGAGRMAVTFDGLSKFLRGRMPDQLPAASNPQACDGVIRVLDPVPKSKCRVQVNGVSAEDALELVVSDLDGEFDPRHFPFKGPSFTVELSPNDYGIQVVAPGGKPSFARVDPPEDMPVDLWDDRDLVFVAQAGDSAPNDLMPTRLRVMAPPGTRVSLFRGGKEAALPAAKSGPHDGDSLEDYRLDSAGPGEYRLELRERGSVISRRDITLRPGEDILVALRGEGEGRVRDEILRRTGNDPGSDLHEVSETLRPFADANLGLLLGLAGASRIVAPAESFEKLRHLPLATFDDSEPDAAEIYVLAAFDDALSSGPPPQIAVHRGADDVLWHAARPVPGIDGLWDYRARVAPAPVLVSISVPGRPVITLASHALQGRATLITLADGAGDDALDIHQYMVPLHRSRERLPPEQTWSHGAAPPLPRARLIWLAQNRFAAKRPLSFEPGEQAIWQELLDGQWVDPMMGILTAYDLVRGGGLERKDPSLDRIARDLQRFFGGVADVRLLGRLAGDPWARPDSPPLVRHGLLAWPPELGPAPAPLPPEKLLFQGMWTAWRDAVPVPVSLPARAQD